MKQFLSTVLAGVMCLSLSVPSFAATTKYTVLDFGMEPGANLMENGYLLDEGKVSAAAIEGQVVPGDVVYVPVKAYQSTSPDVEMIPENLVNKTSALNDFKVTYRINDDERLFGSMEWVTKKDTSNESGLYLAITLRDKPLLEDIDADADVIITPKNTNATVGSHGSEAELTGGPAEFKASVTIGYPQISTDGGYEYVEKSGAVLLEMDRDAEDLTLCFPGDVEVSGNFRGTKDTIYKMSSFSSALSSKYPFAEFRLFKSNNTNVNTLKRSVKVVIPYDVETPYLYEVMGNGLVELYGKGKGVADYKDEAFVFETSKLGDYVLSDEPLTSKAPADSSSSSASSDTTDSSSTTTAPSTSQPNPDDGTSAVPNPDTGASDFAGLAVALAVVSVAGIAVAMKK